MANSKIIDGKKLALIREKKLKRVLRGLKIKPKVVSILIGDDPSSVLYTEIKQKKAVELGITFEPKRFSGKASFEEAANLIKKLNADQTVSGIMVQLPLPEQFLKDHQPADLLNLIKPKKDVDGLRSKSSYLTAAVEAVMSILDEEKIPVKGRKAVVIGASDLVGRPAAKQLQKRGAKVDLCDSTTADLRQKTQSADIIVSATGVPGLLIGKMVKDGVVVIDVGAEKVDGKVVGDVDFETVAPKASKITPVPGGVGPMTVISLMENVVKSAQKGKS